MLTLKKKHYLDLLEQKVLSKSRNFVHVNKTAFAISNRKTKTSELLLIKYIEITKLFRIAILIHFIINNSPTELYYILMTLLF